MNIPLHLYLPIAGNSVSMLVILSLGGGVGLLSGIFGVGGGFLMTPLLIMFGIPPTVAAASDSNQIVGASASGTLAHFRLGNVDFKMGLLLLVGGVAGGTVGVQIIKVLRQLGNADFLINLTYVLMLGIIGGYMFAESLQSMRKTRKNIPSSGVKKESLYGRMAKILPWQMEFRRSGIRLSLLMPLVLGTLVGILAAIMGVGGGFIMVPVMVYLLRMPMHVVVGTSLFQILFTCVNVTIMQAWENHTVDFVLALLLLIGSSTGAQVGARLGRKLRGDQLKILLASLVLLVMIEMLYELPCPARSTPGLCGGTLINEDEVLYTSLGLLSLHCLHRCCAGRCPDKGRVGGDQHWRILQRDHPYRNGIGSRRQRSHRSVYGVLLRVSHEGKGKSGRHHMDEP